MKKLLFVILVFTTLSSIQAVNANLTNEEREWLAKHQTIRIAPDPEFPPIEWFDKNGVYQGISSEFMDLISRDLGIHFEVVHCNNWDEVLQKARDREVDMLPAAAQTPQRAEYMDFSQPHLIFQGVIITRNDFHEIKTIEQLQGKKVVIVSGYVWQDFLSLNHSEIDIVPVNSLLDGLRDVSTGVQDVMIATLPVALYYIEQEGILNLRVSGETGYFTKLSILTRKDWPMLGTIIQKSLSNIPANKKKK
ncbi:MAG: transporter substrate-binding domain-containing protein [FCB group bacterium]|nr:transporter substrate-binding domain-containing protein [FCB group bacterium]